MLRAPEPSAPTGALARAAAPSTSRASAPEAPIARSQRRLALQHVGDADEGRRGGGDDGEEHEVGGDCDGGRRASASECAGGERQREQPRSHPLERFAPASDGPSRYARWTTTKGEGCRTRRSRGSATPRSGSTRRPESASTSTRSCKGNPEVPCGRAGTRARRHRRGHARARRPRRRHRGDRAAARLDRRRAGGARRLARQAGRTPTTRRSASTRAAPSTSTA